MGHIWPFCLFSSFSQYNEKYSTKFDYVRVLEIRTRDRTLVGADESTTLWLCQVALSCFSLQRSQS